MRGSGLNYGVYQKILLTMTGQNRANVAVEI